jgi:hypothetical protein
MALFLETTPAGGAPVRIPIGPGKFRINARAGETYRLVDSTGQIPPGSLVKRLESMLIVELANGQIVEIGNFFDVCKPGTGCGFALDTLGGPAGAMLDGGSVPTVAALPDGSALMYSQDGSVPTAPPAPSSPTDWKMIAAIGGGALLVGAAAAGGSGSSGSGGVTVDTTPPDAPQVTSVLASRDQTPTISGTAEPGSRVRLVIDLNGNGASASDAGDVVFITTAQSNGAWSIDTGALAPSSGRMPAGGLPAGAYQIAVTATDAAGNASAVATPTLTIDLTAPAAPTIGTVASDNVVSAFERAAGVEISGQAEVGGTVNVTWGGVTRSGVADATGTYRITFASSAVPPDGSSTISATVTDPAGNVGPAATRTVLIDTTAPLVPTIASGPAGVTNDRTPVVAGGAEANSAIAVDLDLNRDGVNDVRYTTTAGSNGLWSIDLGTATPVSGALPAGGITDQTTVGLRVTSTDAAGNASLANATLRVDSTVPAGPTIDAVAGDDSVSAAERAAGVTVTGTVAEANRPVTVTWGATSIAATVTGTTWSAAFGSGQVPADGATTVSATFVNTAGTTSTATNRPVNVDTVAPTLTITDNVAGTATGPVTYTFQFAEPVTGFTQGDITVAGAAATVSGFTAVDADTYTAIVTPPAGSGSFTVSVAAGTVQDVAGNASTAAASSGSQAFAPADSTPPTMAITDNVPGATTNGPVTFTFTASEAITGFTAGDVNVTGGTITTPFASAGGNTWTLTVTPTANTNAGSIDVSVAAGAFQDGVGNLNTAPASASQAYDTQAPSLSITDATAGTANGPVTYTFQFGETVTGFTQGDITVTGAAGTVSGFTAVDGDTYTAIVTPPAGSGSFTVSVAAGAAQDTAGNGNVAASSSAQAFAPGDSTPPTMTITDNVPGATTNGPVTFTFTASEAITNFVAGDVSVTGGTITTPFASSGGNTWTLTVTPTANTNAGSIDVSVAAGAFQDTAGNLNTAPASASQAYDTQAPTQTVSSAAMTETPGGTPIAVGGSTSDASPRITITLSGLLGTGETLSLTRDGTPVASASAGAGSLTHDETLALAAGSYSYAATITDAAGNVSTLDLDAGSGLTTYRFTVI